MESVIRMPPVVQKTLGQWLQEQQKAGARSFLCEIVPDAAGGVKILLLGLDHVAGANSAWEVEGNRLRATVLAEGDVSAIWGA